MADWLRKRNRMDALADNAQPIDFVITWVDGSDPDWLNLKNAYSDEVSVDNAQSNDRARYEDWNLLRYWFRGIETFAPWVNRIHFVTWGHVPNWLNVDHPKISVVKHEEFIPEEYTPTFSSHPIELNLHRIKGLAERFVYFNDDMFVIDETEPSDFFKKGLPCMTAGLVPFRVSKGDGLYYPLNNVALINDHFNVRKSVLSNIGKWFNARYGLAINCSSLFMLPFPAFYGFYESHLPISFLKSTFEKIWDKEYVILDKTSRHRFRDPTDVSPWVVENWQLASGQFVPRSVKFGKAFYLNENIDLILLELVDYLRHQKGKAVCVNDGVISREAAAHAQKEMQGAFARLFPSPSSFEL